MPLLDLDVRCRRGDSGARRRGLIRLMLLDLDGGGRYSRSDVGFMTWLLFEGWVVILCTGHGVAQGSVSLRVEFGTVI